MITFCSLLSLLGCQHETAFQFLLLLNIILPPVVGYECPIVMCVSLGFPIPCCCSVSCTAVVCELLDIVHCLWLSHSARDGQCLNSDILLCILSQSLEKCLQFYSCTWNREVGIFLRWWIIPVCITGHVWGVLSKCKSGSCSEKQFSSYLYCNQFLHGQ